MAVAFAAYVDGTASSGSSTAVVDLSARSEGDLVFVFISRQDPTGPSGVPSGWDLITSQTTGAGAWVYAKVLGAGDLGTATWTWAGSTKTLAHAAAYTGHDAATPVETSAAGTIADGSTADCGSISTTEPMVVAFCSCYSTSAKTYNALSGWTERRDHGTTSPDLWHLIADTDGTWGGGTCNPDFTISASAFYAVGFVVAVNAPSAPPAASGFMVPRWPGVW